MSAPPIKPIKTITLKADTGATNHYISTNDLGYLHVKIPSETCSTIHALVPTGHIMQSQSHVNLPISHIPSPAKLASGSLVSIGKICDANCTAIFDSKSVNVYQNKHIHVTTKNKPVISCTRNSPLRPLYSTQLPTTANAAAIPTPSNHTIPVRHSNASIHNPSIRNRVAFYNAALFHQP